MAPTQVPFVVALLIALCPGTTLSQKFFPDDPIAAMPDPLPVKDPVERDLNALYDFLANSIRTERRAACRAAAINTIGEVPDSEWFTNRHGKSRMTREQLQRGSDTDKAPRPPFTVIAKKDEGISLGFRMTDADGRLYFVKADPLDYPELATGAEVVASKFFHAIGYNVPENYILSARLEDFAIAPDAEMAGSRYKPPERMAWGNFLDIVNRIPRRKDGSFRLLASLAVEGEPIGPFRFESTRRDDPNDIVPHEDRRDLRGLHVFSAWLNHTDTKSLNTLDTVVEKTGVKFVRHYLIDFGATLGSDGDRPKDPRFGHEFILPDADDAAKIPTAGLLVERWEWLHYPDLKAVGNFEWKGFDPAHWRSNYPNLAFLSRRIEDEFWAAKIVMSFTDDDIRTLVQTGQYSNPAVVAYLTQALIERRNRIGRVYFSRILALDHFEIRDGTLRFEDLGTRHAIRANAQYETEWFEFNNQTRERRPLSGSTASLPQDATSLTDGAFLVAEIRSPGVNGQSVAATFRKNGTGFTLVGVDRTTLETLAVSECAAAY